MKGDYQFIIPTPGVQYSDVRVNYNDVTEDDALQCASELAYRLGATKMGDVLGGKENTAQNVSERPTMQIKTMVAVGGTKVKFDPSTHTYFDGYIGGSSFAERFVNTPDFEMIANKKKKADGETTEDVLDQWDKKGEFARAFGTAMHTAIEQKIKYNDACPIPLLDELADDIKTRYEDGIPELFVANVEHKTCGFIDLLVPVDKDKKIVNIVDYKSSADLYRKINFLAPFDKEEKILLTEYAIQLSVYADCLETAGYKVKDIFVEHMTGEHFVQVKVNRLDLTEAYKELQ